MDKINWKKVIGWGIMAAIIGCVIYFNKPQEKKEDELVVAVNLPLSGPISSFTGPYTKGLEMGIKDELTVQGLPESSVRFLIGDNQGQAMIAATIFKQQGLNDYDVYIAGTSEMASAIVNNVNPKKAFIPVAFDEQITEKGENNVRILANFALTKQNLFSFIEKKNPKKVAVIAGCPVCQQFAERQTLPFLQEKGIAVHKEFFEWGFKEFRTVALKVKEYNPDLILVNAYASELERMIQTLREYGLIKNENTWASMDLVDLLDKKSPVSLDGIVFDTAEYTLNPDKDFIERYTKIYGLEPTYTSAYGYDTGRLIVKAWVKSGKVTPETLIAQTPYDGVTGHFIMDSKIRDLISTQTLGILKKDGTVIEWK